MPIAMTLDQRASRHAPDRVEAMISMLNGSFVDELSLPFVRTAGDEMQGMIGSGQGLADVATACLESGGWWIGIGIGALDGPPGATTRETRGPALWHAREAVERARQRKGGSPGPVAVVGDPPARAESLEAALSGVAFIVRHRTRRQRSAVEHARQRPGLQHVATSLGISLSAASYLLRAAGLEEQKGLERLVGRLAEECV